MASVEVQTRTAEVGDQFHYEISNTVTVKRKQSALVPILQSTFDGERVALYNREIRKKNPMSAVRFRNETAMTLEGGTVVVFEGESYVGESMMETVKPGDERFLPYSVELGVTVTIDHESRVEDVHFARLVRGALHLFRYRIRKTIYVVRNKLEHSLPLYLDHPYRRGWKLVSKPRPEEKTERFMRFRVELPGGETTRFEVVERGDETESYDIRSVSKEDLATWVRRRYLDDDTRKVLEGLMELNERSAQLQRWISQREAQIEQIFENQARMRSNLEALGTSPDEKALRDRYVAELSADEDRLREFRQQIEGWQKEREELERQAAEIVERLSFERPI